MDEAEYKNGLETGSEIWEKLKKYDLNEKQKKFCFFYLQDFNASQAAIKAGYSKKSAYVQGCRLLKSPMIEQALTEIKKELTRGEMVEALDVLNMYARISFADIGDYVEILGEGKEATLRMKDLKEVDGQVIDEIYATSNGIHLKLCDRMRALEKLEKYFDLLSESWRRELEERKLELHYEKKGTGVINVITNIPRPMADENDGTET